MTVPALRVSLDGDSNKVYNKGDKVTGRVELVVEEKKEIESLKIVFAGSCITKTSRPSHEDPTSPRREYEEKIRLFNRDKVLLPHSTLEPKKHSWAFEFIFPASTEQSFKRMVHGANYLREPHPLPPSFQLKTCVPGGTAQISYFVQAKLILNGSEETKRCKHTLRYHSTPLMGVPRTAKVISSVLYGQVFKPAKDNDSRVRKVFSGVAVSMTSMPRIVPTLNLPDKVAPGQHIPLSLSLLNTRDPANHAERSCTIDSLSVSISTYSTTQCGNSVTDPEDVVSKHVTCIARTGMNRPIPFNQTRALTSNFRLINDDECVPTFKTYTITRRYALDVKVGIKYNDQHFTIRSNTPLEILPRIPRTAFPESLEEGEEVEALPMYTPREPSREYAPDYEELFGSDSASLSSPVMSRSSSLSSGGLATSTAASTPVREVEELRYDGVMV
jgi:hypothetical protein